MSTTTPDASDSGISVSDKWENAGCWHELINLNRAFLRRETDSTPYYSAAIDDETIPLAEDLLMLHDFGFLTFESQPARVEGPGRATVQCCEHHAFKHSKQRAFLSFLAPTKFCIEPDTLKSFCDALMASDDFYTSVLSSSGFCRRGCCKVAPQSRCNFPEKWETHMRAFGKTRKELKAKELKPYKHIDPWCDGVIHTFSRNENDVVKDHQPLVISILAKDYKKINLAAMVLEIADEVGLDPECLEEDSEEEDSDNSTEDSDMSG